MLMALWLASLLLFAGQTSTHTPHPVQSSGATCSVYRSCSMPRHFALDHWNVAGALSPSSAPYTFARITACGHTITHFPHWMHNSLSHTGINCAMLRFSHCELPLGKAPPAGILLTGSKSPRPAAISPSTSRTNSGAFTEMAGTRSNADEALAGSSTFSRCASA